MTATKHENSSRLQRLQSIGFFSLFYLNLAIGHYWPGSTGASIVKYVFLTWAPIWIAFRIRTGYLRRRPHWTAASWLRYSRLAAIPVIALSLVLYVSSFDMSSGVLGGPGSAMRAVSVVIMLAMMLLGAIGLMAAIDWLAKGEPSEQFTRTRWFQRRRAQG